MDSSPVRASDRVNLGAGNINATTTGLDQHTTLSDHSNYNTPNTSIIDTIAEEQIRSQTRDKTPPESNLDDLMQFINENNPTNPPKVDNAKKVDEKANEIAEQFKVELNKTAKQIVKDMHKNGHDVKIALSSREQSHPPSPQVQSIPSPPPSPRPYFSHGS